MNNPLNFFVELLDQPLWVPIWVGVLMIVNMGSLLFRKHIEAKVVLITFMVSVMLMMTLYSIFGFEKIIALGHILWIAMIPYLLIRLPRIDHPPFKTYLLILIATNTLSLAFDLYDVFTYFSSSPG